MQHPYFLYLSLGSTAPIAWLFSARHSLTSAAASAVAVAPRDDATLSTPPSCHLFGCVSPTKLPLRAQSGCCLGRRRRPGEAEASGRPARLANAGGAYLAAPPSHVSRPVNRDGGRGCKQIYDSAGVPVLPRAVPSLLPALLSPPLGPPPSSSAHLLSALCSCSLPSPPPPPPPPQGVAPAAPRWSESGGWSV